MKTKKRLLVLALAILLIVTLLTGCKSGETGKSGDKDGYTFGATYWTMNNPYFVALEAGIRAAVEANGDKLISYDPQGNQSTQISQIEDMIAQKVDLIFLNPCDYQGVRPALESAQKAGIPIIVVDTPVYDTDLVLQTVWSDNYNAGELVAEDLLTRMSSGNIVILDLPTDKSATDRYNGFVDVIEKAGGFTILDVQNGEGSTEKSLAIMDDMIQAYGDKIDVAFGINDPSALGIMSSLEAANMKDVIIYGVDGSPDAKVMIKDGKMTATSAQFPKEIGKIAAEQAYKHLKGETIEKEIFVPVELVNAETLSNYTLDDWE
jgi:ribose transport system substrate-binding protein